MAVEHDKSVQLGYADELPDEKVVVHDEHGKLRIAYFDFTKPSPTGDAGSDVQLVRLPPGRVRLILPLSRIAFSALGTSRTLDLGWAAYVGLDGVTVIADQNGLDDGVDAASAGSVVPGGTVGGAETVLFASRSGVILTAQVNDGTFVAADTLNGYFVYVTD